MHQWLLKNLCKSCVLCHYGSGVSGEMVQSRFFHWYWGSQFLDVTGNQGIQSKLLTFGKQMELSTFSQRDVLEWSVSWNSRPLVYRDSYVTMRILHFKKFCWLGNPFASTLHIFYQEDTLNQFVQRTYFFRKILGVTCWFANTV